MKRHLQAGGILAATTLMGAAWLGRAAVTAQTPSAATQTAATQATMQTSERGIKPYVSWSGHDSKITGRSYRRVTSFAEWVKLWHQHQGKTPPKSFNFPYDADIMPQVAFDTCEVVAVFVGSTQHNRGVSVVAVIETADEVEVRFQDHPVQSAVGSISPATPYGIFVLPRTDKTIVLEQGKREGKNQAYRWEERARLTAP